MKKNAYIGYITGGSFSEGLTFKLDRHIPTENVRIGDFVVVEGKNEDFLCEVDDIRLKTTTDEVFFEPVEEKDELERLAVSSFVYSEVSIFPYVTFSKTDSKIFSRSVKTLPSHFSPVRKANDEDLRRLIPEENAFYIGTPLTTNAPVYIDLTKLSMRNAGLFGITGSGKSFLARMLFAGLIKKGISTLLIFDMHNEHGKSIIDEQNNMLVSLAGLFPSEVKIYDVDSSNKDAANFIVIPYMYIEPEDLELVSDLLDFSPKSLETLEIVALKKKDYMHFLIEEYPALGSEERDRVIEELNVNLESLNALSRHLQKLKRLAFLKDSEETSSIDSIMKDLSHGVSVVVQFSGAYKDDKLVYYLVSNILTRRIYEKFSNFHEEDKNPKRITIAVEEAHKFLSRQYQMKNVFGKIAREMRKFNVTLFIIDQRPSEIDPEVLSQIGTRLVMELKDEHDIEAVFQGASHSKRLMKLLSTLEQGQALVFGYAVPLPLPVNVRKYDRNFIEEIRSLKNNTNPIEDIY